jgi:hypothetical protein
MEMKNVLEALKAIEDQNEAILGALDNTERMNMTVENNTKEDMLKSKGSCDHDCDCDGDCNEACECVTNESKELDEEQVDEFDAKKAEKNAEKQNKQGKENPFGLKSEKDKDKVEESRDDRPDCDECDGTGNNKKGYSDDGGKYCPACDGDGKVNEDVADEDRAAVLNDMLHLAGLKSIKESAEESGTYVYSGLGAGTYHSATGKQIWCSPQEANAMAREDGVKFRYIDKLKKNGTVAVKDSKMNESDDIADADRAAMLGDMLKLAGLKPQIDEEYANEPDPTYGDTDLQVNGMSGGLNGAKKQWRREFPGDNPKAVQDIKENLTGLWVKMKDD